MGAFLLDILCASKTIDDFRVNKLICLACGIEFQWKIRFFFFFFIVFESENEFMSTTRLGNCVRFCPNFQRLPENSLKLELEVYNFYFRIIIPHPA